MISNMKLYKITISRYFYPKKFRHKIKQASTVRLQLFVYSPKLQCRNKLVEINETITSISNSPA